MSNWKNKVIVVTGASSGLGKEIALAFHRAGGTVVLLARRETTLQQIVVTTNQDSTDSNRLTYEVCDVTSDDSVAHAITNIKERLGRLDVWVNNVGRSTRAKLDDTTIADYQTLMELNFYTAVRCSSAALPELSETSGIVVNIGSLAAKTAWPLMSPYSASKHALAAYSHQLRLEGPPNVDCLLVCPGPIQREDANHRYAEQANGLGKNAHKPGAGVKLKGLAPDKLAEQIVLACSKRKKVLIVPWKTKLLFTIAQISPSLGDWILNKSSKK